MNNIDTNNNNNNSSSNNSNNNSSNQFSNYQSIFEYDELKMYFGEDYWVTDKIKISQPSIGQILNFGDVKFYSIINTLCGNTTTFRLQLWDMGIDWNKISDFELFSQLIVNYTPKDTYLLFGDLNFSWFKPFIKQEDNSLVLIYIPKDKNGNDIKMDEINFNNAIVIDEFVYLKIVDYLRYMFDIHPKVQKAKGKTTKEWIIESDRREQAIEERKREKEGNRSKSPLYPLISSMLNHPGFKYKKNELKEVGIVEFMDSVKRLQTYESITAFMSGMYSGMVDTSKMNLSEELNWMKDLYK